MVIGGILAAALGTTAAAAAPSIPQIAGQPRATVDAQLGEPRCQASKYGQKCLYAGGVEVVYINGLADWITVNNEGDMRYSPAALREIGLDCSIGAVTSGQDEMRWDGTCQGLLVVSMFPGERTPDGGLGVRYVYIKARTR